MARVLVADTPQAVVSLESILKGHELVISNTMEAAQNSLETETFDLIVVGVHFDNSQMFELIRYVQQNPNNASKPIISFCARDTEMTRVIHESIEVASKAAGAWMYLDAHSYNVYKDPEEELRRIIDRCLTEGSRKEIQERRLDIQKQRAGLQQLRLMLKAQEWTPELEEYLGEVRHDLEVLLEEVNKLQMSSDAYRSKVAASRQFKDRVSTQVAMTENGLERTERIQHLDERRQSIQERQMLHEEQERKANSMRDRLNANKREDAGPKRDA